MAAAKGRIATSVRVANLRMVRRIYAKKKGRGGRGDGEGLSRWKARGNTENPARIHGSPDRADVHPPSQFSESLRALSGSRRRRAPTTAAGRQPCPASLKYIVKQLRPLSSLDRQSLR